MYQRGDRSVGQVARDFDLTETAVREWVKQAERDAATRDDGGLTSNEREFAQLRAGAELTRSPPEQTGESAGTAADLGGARPQPPRSVRGRLGQSTLAGWRLTLAGSRPTAPIAGARVSQSPIVTTIDVR